MADAPAGVGAVKVVPLTPVPENAPGLPAPGTVEPTGVGVAVRVRVVPAHISALDEVIVRLLFCRIVVVTDEMEVLQLY